MSKKKSKQEGVPSKYMLLGTTAMFAAFGFQAAYAQEAEEPAVETAVDGEDEARQDVVVIEGVRGALQNARNLKRDAETFVDSITASDVSQLPDLSVAEALARVPGVVTQRFELGGSDGDFPSPEGSGNIVRGLQYVRSEFNGRDAFSANGGRALEWASVPPDLIGAVDVFKNQSADMIEGGIAGSVNLRTLEPFDRDGRVGAIIVDGTYTDLREEFTPGISAVFGDRWETDSGEFGLMGAYSTSELKSAVQGFQYGMLLSLDNPDVEGSRIAVPGGFQARDARIDRERDSYYLAGQWRSPDGSKELTLKATRVENYIQTNENTIEFFIDAESVFNWNILGDPSTRNIVPFTSPALPLCNGAGIANQPDAAGDPSWCENTLPVDGGLMEAGVVSNGLRDWLGQTGQLQTPLQSLAINQQEESMTQDFSANFKWRVNDQLFVEIDGHYTDAEATLERLWAGGNHFADYRYDFSDAENPEIEFFLSDEVQLADWGTTRGPNPGILGDIGDPRFSYLLYAADQFEDNTGDLVALRGDVTYEFFDDGWFDAVKFGARVSEREQVNRSAGLNWGGIAPPWAGGYLPYANMDNADFYEAFDFADFQRGGVFQGDITSVVFPSQANMANISAFQTSLSNEPLLGALTNADGNLQVGDWVPLLQNGVVDYANRGIDGNVKEETVNLYAMVKFGQEFENGQALSGNAGLRYVRTENSGGGVLGYAEIVDPVARGFLPETAALFDTANAPNTIDNSYDYVLPSVNVKWNLNDEMLIRFAASKAITRPDIAALNASRTAVAELGYIVDEGGEGGPGEIIDVGLGRVQVYGGNPNLKPIEATNFDLSYEWYFGSDGQFSVSAFYKDLKNIIVYGTETIDILSSDGYDVPVVLNSNLNLNDGTVEGVEFAYQQFFTEWPGLFGNLGVQANLTFLNSDSTPLTPAFGIDGGADGFLTVYRWGVDDLLGLSESSYNLIGIYQDDQFEARLAYNWRSEYVSSYRDFITGNPITQEDIGFLDASFRWDLTDQVQLRLQGANLLDTRSVASQQVDALGQSFARASFANDRRYEIGIRYEF